MTGIQRRDFLRMGAATLATGLLGGCLTEPFDGPSDPHLSARPGTPGQTVSPGLHRLDLGERRDGYLYVPHSYDGSTALPLYVALHGAGGQALDWRNYFDRADARDLVMLVPESRRQTWDMARGELGPDVEFLDRALAHTFDRCRIDASRMGLAGFSDGASYALSLGVSNGDLFTHLLAYSPGFFAPGGPAVGRPRVFVSHGTSDPILPVTSSRDLIVPRFESDGYEVHYEEFEGGHEVPRAIGIGSLDWFMA